MYSRQDRGKMIKFIVAFVKNNTSYFKINSRYIINYINGNILIFENKMIKLYFFNYISLIQV